MKIKSPLFGFASVLIVLCLINPQKCYSAPKSEYKNDLNNETSAACQKYADKTLCSMLARWEVTTESESKKLDKEILDLAKSTCKKTKNPSDCAIEIRVTQGLKNKKELYEKGCQLDRNVLYCSFLGSYLAKTPELKKTALPYLQETCKKDYFPSCRLLYAEFEIIDNEILSVAKKYCEKKGVSACQLYFIGMRDRRDYDIKLLDLVKNQCKVHKDAISCMVFTSQIINHPAAEKTKTNIGLYEEYSKIGCGLKSAANCYKYGLYVKALSRWDEAISYFKSACEFGEKEACSNYSELNNQLTKPGTTKEFTGAVWRDLLPKESIESVIRKHPDWCINPSKVSEDIQTCGGPVPDVFIETIEFNFYKNQLHYFIIKVKDSVTKDYEALVDKKFEYVSRDGAVSPPNICFNSKIGLLSIIRTNKTYNVISCQTSTADAAAHVGGDITFGPSGYYIYVDPLVDSALNQQLKNKQNEIIQKDEQTREQKLKGAM